MFDGYGLASGVYIYRLKAGNFIQTKRTFLIKTVPKGTAFLYLKNPSNILIENLKFPAPLSLAYASALI